MSRNGAGVYSLPAGSTVANGDTSDASDLNVPLADIEADMNVARPIVAGGTGASSAAGALINLGLTATAAELNTLDGITASVSELNILDGATLTVTELNYVDGVTSAIQAQLNAKQATITTLPLANGGTGAALVDPGADRLLFWDDSAGAVAFLDAGTALPISGTTASAWTYTAPVSLVGLATNDFTGIPAGVTEMKVFLSVVSLTGTNNIEVLLGTSGGMIATGYYSLTSTIDGTGAGTNSSTTSFLLFGGIAVDAMSGFLTFLKGDSNKWFLSATVARGGSKMTIASGEVDLGAALTQLRVKTTGANTFDGSSAAYIAYR